VQQLFNGLFYNEVFFVQTIDQLMKLDLSAGVDVEIKLSAD